tara:strand:- start:345 stop:806 length:462 start_codon:yes stop_codon:yes gene_type:complete
MQRIRNILLIFTFISIINCGYSPLLTKEKNNFYIENLSIEGNRKINAQISNGLKKYQISDDNFKKYDLKVETSYEKKISNKDDDGNPKNFNLQVKALIIVKNSDGVEKNKSFSKNVSLSAESKKITEKEREKKYIKDLSNLIVKDIIFFISNN